MYSGALDSNPIDTKQHRPSSHKIKLKLKKIQARMQTLGMRMTTSLSNPSGACDIWLYGLVIKHLIK